MSERRRHRARYLLLIPIVVALGLGSRSGWAAMPGFVAEYAGDTLWALTAFLAVGLLAPTISTLRAASIAAAFALLIELSQLHHAAWIDGLRDTRVGGLVLGYGFLWSDLACYAVGITIGVAGEAVARRMGNGRGRRSASE